MLLDPDAVDVDRVRVAAAPAAHAAALRARGAIAEHDALVRIVLTFRCHERVTLRVTGVRPTGGGLGVLRGLMRAMAGSEEYTLAFSLGGHLDGPIHLALDLCTSPLRPWPRLRHVSLVRAPPLVLEREILDVEDEIGFVSALLAVLPKEVLIGHVESTINEQLHRLLSRQGGWLVGAKRWDGDAAVAAAAAAAAAATGSRGLAAAWQ